MVKQDIVNHMALDSAWTQENFENRISSLIDAGAEIDRILANDSHHTKYFAEFMNFFSSKISTEDLTEQH